ncbi:MAG: Periplasmic pH-dependent serine endoprotease DegQ [Chlamydiae bacterium]|nr:Periplasmic pH-dependent serine endoprotease DegQ [Chlamydiota bacterium]
MKRFLILFSALLLSSTLFAAQPECTCTPKQISKFFTAVAKKATPAVVYIKAEVSDDDDDLDPNRMQNPQDPFGDDFFNRFFGRPNQKMPKRAPVSQGSGFFVNSDGHIMTNAHVIKGASKITVVMNDGRKIPATVIGIDASTDIGIIKVEGKDFPFVELGNSDDMEVGAWVVAIGSPFQLQASVTVGVISAKGRQNLRITDFEDFLQTDAAINPGNSGGPLLNLEAEVIGINTAIVSKSGGYIGIGFAIPSNMAKHIMNQLIENGSVVRGFLGVVLQPIDQDMADAFGLKKPEGALIAEVIKGSPAEKAGLKQGDIIVAFNKEPVKTIGTLRNEISMIKPGKKITLKVNRNGKELSFQPVLGSHNDHSGGSSFIKKLGMEVEPLTPDIATKLGYTNGEEGVIVTKVKPASTAAIAGIRPGFLIMAINHQKVTSVEEFNKALEKSTEKNRILILAKQGNVTRFYSLKLE